MIFLAISWLLILSVLTGLGIGAFSLFTRALGDKYGTTADIFQFAWLGYASLIAIFQIYSLFLPIDQYAVLVLIVVSLLGYFFNISLIRKLIQTSAKACGNYGYLLVIGVLIITAVQARNAFFMPIHYDTELYNLNAVKWINNFPAVPGIVHLHARLALNSSFHLFAAATNIWLGADRAIHIANGFLLLLLSCQFFFHITCLMNRKGSLQSYFAILTFPLLAALSYGGTIPSLSTDLPYVILSLATIMMLLSTGQQSSDLATWRTSLNSHNLLTWLMTAALATAAFSTKLAAAPLLAIILFTSLYLAIQYYSGGKDGRLSFTILCAMYILPFLIIAGLIIRYVILSGWLVYPFPIGNLHLEWSSAPEQVVNMLNWTLSWARMPGIRPEEVLGNGMSYWLIPWLVRFSHNYLALLLLFFGCGTIIYAVLCNKLKQYSFPFALAITISVTEMLFWFVSAPDYRFVEVFFWVFAAAATAPFLMGINHKNRFVLIIVLISLTSATLWLKNIQQEIRTPNPFTDTPHLFTAPRPAFPRIMLTRVLVNNGQTPPLVVYKPVNTDMCGNSPLPCSPYVDENSTIVYRVPGDLTKGFKASGPNPPDMHR